MLPPPVPGVSESAKRNDCFVSSVVCDAFCCDFFMFVLLLWLLSLPVSVCTVASACAACSFTDFFFLEEKWEKVRVRRRVKQGTTTPRTGGPGPPQLRRAPHRHSQECSV